MKNTYYTYVQLSISGSKNITVDKKLLVFVCNKKNKGVT